MFLSRNKLLLLCAIILSSCGFADLRPVLVTITPDGSNSVLQSLYSPIMLEFNTEMAKHETEGVLQVNSDIGTVSGDKYWEGDSLYFVPVQGWTAGVRYTLNLVGTIQAEDGREARIERFISFYAINKNPPPSLDSFNPSNGSSVSVNNSVFEFNFSRSMDKISVESAIVINGIGNKTFKWLDEDRVLNVIPDNALSPWTMYRWNIKDSAKSADGVPLAGSYSGYFITDLDKTYPHVTEVYPVSFSDGCWYPAGINMEAGLFPGYGIAVSFNKPMGESALRSIRFEPSLTGRTEFLSEDSVVYIFTRDPDPETVYTLIVSGDAKDSEGIKTGSDYKLNFNSDIQFLRVNSISVNEISEYDCITSENKLIQTGVTPGTGQILLSINFSLRFSAEEKQNAPQRVQLSPFFPKTLKPVALLSVNWISDDRLCLKWEGLTLPEGIPHFYKLVIPGGKGGISAGTGVFMKEDLIFYLEAVK